MDDHPDHIIKKQIILNKNMKEFIYHGDKYIELIPKCNLDTITIALLSRYIKCEYETFFVIEDTNLDPLILFKFKNNIFIIHPSNLKYNVIKDCMSYWLNRYLTSNKRKILK